MNTVNRVDIVPGYNIVGLGEVITRAKECGMNVVDVLDIQLEGEHYKELLMTGSRWNYIKYTVRCMREEGFEIGALPGIIKLMFMR